MKRFVISLFACGAVWTSTAQPFTLDDCLASAVEHNRTLQNSRLELDAAGQTRLETFTNYFPQISASAGTFRATGGLVQADFAVPQMGTLPISMMNRGTFGGIAAMQPVFAGLQIRNGYRLARLGEEVGRLQVQRTEAEIRERTETYYWQIVSLRENLSTLDAVERQLNEIHRQATLSVEAGLVTTNDLLRVELRQKEVASDRLKLENGLKVCFLLLAQYIGADRQSFDIVSDTDFTAPENPTACYISTEEAIDRRAEMRLSEKSVEAKRLQTRMERGKRLPTVGIGAGYVYNDLTKKDVTEGLIFAQISVPISGWWGGSHALKKARIEEKQAENDREQAREMLAVEIEKCWFDLLESHAQIELAQRSVTSATENLRQQRNFYGAGTGSLTDLLEAETLYMQSRNNLTAACAAYRTALAVYKRATGR